MRSNPLLVGVVWGLVELTALVIAVEIGVNQGNEYFAQTGRDLGAQLSLLFVLAIALVVGLYLKDVETSLKALLPAQLVAYLFFSLILPYTQTQIGNALSDPMSEQFGGSVIFLVGLAIASFVIALVGSVIGSLLGEWNARRRAPRPIRLAN